MSPRLGATTSEPPPKSTPQTKNVDGTPRYQGFSGFDVSRYGHIGSGYVRETIRTQFAKANALSAEATKAARIADRIPSALKIAQAFDSNKNALDAARELASLFQTAVPERPATRPLSSPEARAESVAADAARLVGELAELDAEEANRRGPQGFIPPRAGEIAPEDRNPGAVIRFLPPELASFLISMHPARRREREQAIVAYVGWEGLELLGLGPTLLAERAVDRARRYAVQFPRQDEKGDPINQQPVHRKGRCEKWQRRRLVKKQTRALLYVEQALGAVGGPDVPGRPLYVSDYSLILHREQARRTAEILEGLRLVRVDDPTVQIPMAELNEKAKIADVTKRRLLIDMLLRRFADLGWHVCWITITLPGRYVANATNEGKRAEGWNPALGPQEALDALQEMHHQTMALLRERGIRPCGWWNAQPQQSGTPHRHIVVACRTQDDARAVCDAFWHRFSSTPIKERQEERSRADPGCSAYVIGDEDVRYAPPRGKNGKAETAASIAKYAARYSTRYEAAQRSDGAAEKHAGQSGAEQERQNEEQARFAAWKTRRRVRGHTWIGFDSGRSPMEAWDTLWANAMRSDDLPEDPRMALAMRLMRETQAHAANAADFRRRAAAMPFSDDRDAELAYAEEEAERAAFLAWHAGIAMGLWPDTDLDHTELDWLRNETQETDALPPMPLRVTKETAYGEERRTVIGCVAPERRFTLEGRMSVKALLPVSEELGVAVAAPQGGKLRARHILAALKQAGFGLSRRPDGSRAGFYLSGEVLLRTEKEWKVVDTVTAAQMVADADAAMRRQQLEQQEEAERRADAQALRIEAGNSARISALPTTADIGSGGAGLDHLSDSPTDPSYGPAAQAGLERLGDDPPPPGARSQPKPN